MTVVKRKRKPSQFEVYHHLNRLRKNVTELLLRDFGFDIEKYEKKLQKQFGGRSYDELDEAEKTVYDRTMKRWVSFGEWFIVDERKAIIDCLRDITKEVYIANSIYPVCMEELNQRRLHQEEAIGHCYRLVQELQYAIETLPVDVNVYTRVANEVQSQIDLIKGWRKSDNKLKRAISDSATNFANVNSNGNANNNNASNVNGVRPDFDAAIK